MVLYYPWCISGSAESKEGQKDNRRDDGISCSHIGIRFRIEDALFADLDDGGSSLSGTA